MSTRATRVDLEEIEVTRTEKLLAVVLAVFFLIGGVWAYTKLDEVGRSAYPSPQTYFSPAEQGVVTRADEARRGLARAVAAVQEARRDLEFAREAYRTALDAGTPAQALEEDYRRAQRDLDAAQGAEARAEAAADAAFRRASEEAMSAMRQNELVTFLLRLGLVVATLAVGYWQLVRLRRSSSRYLPVAFAFVAFAALLALVMAADYVTDYVDVRQLGPLVISLLGIVMTLAAFWWLQGYLARRIPQRRVRKAECPFCGYPARGSEHCEGCGRTVVGECATCHQPRRVGTFHCGGCGTA